MTALDQHSRRMTVQGVDGPQDFPLPNTNLINVYNALSAVALLCEFGLPKERVAQCMDKLTIVESRYNEVTVNGRRLILHLAKGQNPIACSQACSNARECPGKKAVLLFLDDAHDAAHSVENTAWLYDTDFEFLNSPDILQVVAAGPRHWDVYVRLLMAGIPPEKLCHMEHPLDAAAAVDLSQVDTLFMLYDLYAVELSKQIKGQLKERMAAAPAPQQGKEDASHAD